MSVGGGLLATFILSFHHRTIINMPFTCLLEEGYLISYSARREGLLIKLCPFYSALRGFTIWTSVESNFGEFSLQRTISA